LQEEGITALLTYNSHLSEHKTLPRHNPQARAPSNWYDESWNLISLTHTAVQKRVPWSLSLKFGNLPSYLNLSNMHFTVWCKDPESTLSK